VDVYYWLIMLAVEETLDGIEKCSENCEAFRPDE
jgi:hypothetical protein